jgi:hypothetical protein
MGCSGQRQLGSEESTIFFAEQILNLGSSSLESIFAFLSKNSKNEKITSKDFLFFCKEFEVHQENEGIHSNIEKFFQSLKDSEGSFLKKDLIFLSILLSNTTPDSKSDILFRTFSSSDPFSLDKKVIDEVFSRLFELSASHLPLLTTEKQSDPEMMINIEVYQTHLEKYRKRSKDFLMKKYFDCESVSLETFKKFSNHKPDLLTSSGLRSFITTFRIRFKHEQRILKYPS